MDKWIKESRRIRAGVKAIPHGYPFHLRPDLKAEYDRLMLMSRQYKADAEAVKAKALGM